MNLIHVFSGIAFFKKTHVIFKNKALCMLAFSYQLVLSYLRIDSLILFLGLELNLD